MTYDIAAAVRTVIARSGRTQREIALASGVHFTTITRWARASKTPRVTELEEMLRVTGYGLRVVDLATGEIIEP